jgi:hypothetical protein
VVGDRHALEGIFHEVDQMGKLRPPPVSVSRLFLGVCGGPSDTATSVGWKPSNQVSNQVVGGAGLAEISGQPIAWAWLQCQTRHFLQQAVRDERVLA